MKLKDILTTVGSGLISTLVPGGGAIIELVNGFLPDDKKLPSSATGNDAVSAISALPPETQQSILIKELDVEIEEIKGDTSRFNAMCEVDKTGHTTRPQIALMMAYMVCFAILAMVSLICVVIANRDELMIR